MNILHLDEQTGWRGGEQQASWLLRGLLEGGHNVWLAGRPHSAFLAHDHGGAAVARFPIALRSEVDLLSAYRLSGLVRRGGIDILHAHTSHAHTIACIAARWARRGKVVVSRRVSFRPKIHRLNRVKYAMPDMFIAVSHKVDETLADFGIPASRRRVVHSAVDLTRLDVPPSPRESFGVPAAAPLLVSAGALVPHKDHANLLAALPLVREAFPAVRLLIAGEGPLRKVLDEQIRALNLGNAVTLLGHRDDVPGLIRTADCYVSSSWSEGLGTSILEALACATPVVASRAGGADEMVLPGKTGRLVPVRDADALAAAVIATLSDREGARTMAEAGRAHVEAEFTVARMVTGTTAVYEELLAG